MSDGFYRAFEEKHRGSRELIKSRLRVYLPFIEPLASLHSGARALDLGCGRGEWLELLGQSGFDGHGVDLDDGMLSACRERGLNVVTADAIETLKELPDESQTIVSGFHIAEHIPFPDLQTLVKEALRVLKPAGLLILETPNPENLIVAAVSFYLDPTHQRPIPPQLLSFLPEYYGFARTKLLRLQETVTLSTDRTLTLKDVLAGASPDFAVVAQKAADEGALATFDHAFKADHGISLETLADTYVQQTDVATKVTETRIRQVETATKAAEARAEQAAAKAASAQAALSALHASTSWRLTKPLRAVGQLMRGHVGLALMEIGISRHDIEYFARVFGRRAGPKAAAAQLPTDLTPLTARARRIYADLKAALKNRNSR